MDDRFTTLISFVIGILPTFGLLYAVTSRFESYIKEKDTMTSFIIGLFVGIPLAIAHMFFSFNYGADQVELYIAPLLLAPLEVLAYQIYLNRKKFRGREDLPFIALGFCLGVSATYIGFLAGWMFRSLDTGYDMVLGMVLFGLGVGPLKASVGLLLSRGDVKKLIRPDMLYSVLAVIAFNAFLFIYLYSLFLWTFAVPITVLGIVLFFFNFKGMARSIKAR